MWVFVGIESRQWVYNRAGVTPPHLVSASRVLLQSEETEFCEPQAEPQPSERTSVRIRLQSNYGRDWPTNYQPKDWAQDVARTMDFKASIVKKKLTQQLTHIYNIAKLYIQ
jgi:hypothetical protein